MAGARSSKLWQCLDCRRSFASLQELKQHSTPATRTCSVGQRRVETESDRALCSGTYKVIVDDGGGPDSPPPSPAGMLAPEQSGVLFFYVFL